MISGWITWLIFDMLVRKVKIDVKKIKFAITKWVKKLQATGIFLGYFIIK